jgi:hypothetical protein
MFGLASAGREKYREKIAQQKEPEGNPEQQEIKATNSSAGRVLILAVRADSQKHACSAGYLELAAVGS